MRKWIIHFNLPSGQIKDVYGVLYVSSLKKNLFSIGSFMDKGIIACFDAE